MARMVPDIIGEETRSNAEKTVFGYFERLPREDYIVLHSLALKEHQSKVFGEIDFVVIAKEGILCLEVKGGLVERKDGKWYFTPKSGGESTVKKEGPYDQARGNMYSLLDYLKGKARGNDDPIKKCCFAYGVILTDSCLNENSKAPDIIPKVTFDVRNHEKDFPGFLDNCFKYCKDKVYEKHGIKTGELSEKDRKRVLTILRGNTSFVPKMSIVLDRTDEELVKLTDQQYEIIQSIDADRLLISGAAGTGKTMLAVEQCRQMAAMGYSVLYLCYNKLNAEYVRMQFDEEKDGKIDVYTLHKLMLENAPEAKEIENRDDKFYKEKLPDKFLSSSKTFVPYDVVIIDEAQDILKTNYICCLDKIIKGGLSKGHWIIYYDKNQNIFGENKELEDRIKELKEGFGVTEFKLKYNNRNTKQIADCNRLNTNTENTPSLKALGEKVAYHKYKDKKDKKGKKDKKDEREMLFDRIKELLSQGVKPEDIVILSPFKISNTESCLYDVYKGNVKIPKQIGEIQYDNLENPDSDSAIRFYTVQKFKGLEAKVILYIDIKGFKDDECRLLNYVAMSRARTLLEIFYNENLEDERQEIMKKSLTNK